MLRIWQPGTFTPPSTQPARKAQKPMTNHLPTWKGRKQTLPMD
jgi:hypothetical protein